MNLEGLRKKIAAVDAEIVTLIGERAKIAEEIGKGKKEQNKLIEDKDREFRVLKNVKRIARDINISQADIEDIYSRIIAACKNMEGIEVAFQGELGAYSEEATFQFFGPSVQIRPRETLEEVFKLVEKGEVQFGVIPVENSLEGNINRAYDLLLESNLMVRGEIELRVIHCLIANPETGLDAIKKVYSHPQALAQCRNFLKHLNLEIVPTYDTAGSVKMIKKSGTMDSAAVASARAAEIYGMKVVAREIEDNANNFTRFFILAKEDSPPTGNDKTSIVFSTKEKPGAMYQAIGEFAGRNINLRKIESRPTRQKPWEYNFYMDFQGHRKEDPAREALASLEEVSLFVKILGSYPKAKRKL